MNLRTTENICHNTAEYEMSSIVNVLCSNVNRGVLARCMAHVNFCYGNLLYHRHDDKENMSIAFNAHRFFLLLSQWKQQQQQNKIGTLSYALFTVLCLPERSVLLFRKKIIKNACIFRPNRFSF